MEQGSQNNPIELLDDDQELKRNQQRVQFERNRQALRQAHMGSQFDVLLAVIKLEIKGTEEYKDRVIRARIHKFFDHGSKSINVQTDYFRKRRDPDYSHPCTIPVDNQLIIYGVDFLNAKQIRTKFPGSSIEIQWLDDSHCRVKFENAGQAKKGLQSNLKNKSEDIVKLQSQQIQIPRNWFQLQPYFYLTFQRKLFARYAATNQNNEQVQKSNDFYMFQQARKKFQQSIKNQVEQQYYNVMRKYKLVDEARIRERERMRFGRWERGAGDRGGDRGGDRQRFNRGGNYNGRRDRGQGNDHDPRRNWNDRDNRPNGRGFRSDQMDQRFDDYTRNRDSGRNQQRNNQQSPDQARSRNKRNQDIENDNMSFSSRASNASNRQKKRKFSASICSQQSPIRNKMDDDDDAKSSLSFIFNLEQQNSSNQIINHFNNLSILQAEPQPNFMKKKVKEQQLNLSYISNREDSNHIPSQKNMDLSFNLDDDMRIQKIGKKQGGSHVEHNLSILSGNNGNGGNGGNGGDGGNGGKGFNKKDKDRKADMSMSILGDQHSNRGKKVDHITIYD